VSDDEKPTVLERVLYIRHDGVGLRFMAARNPDRWGEDPLYVPDEALGPLDRRYDEWNIWGGNHPTLFKTFRNAKRAAGRHGVVLLFDPTKLAVADSDEIVCHQSMDELQFAERQVDLWAARAATLQSKAKR
jgi:hypothetical protein